MKLHYFIFLIIGFSQNQMFLYPFHFLFLFQKTMQVAPLALVELDVNLKPTAFLY